MSLAQTLRVAPNPAPVRTQILDNIRAAIVNRQLVPGQRLTERELVELTGASRTSVREALRELTAEGLITNVPNRGSVVTELTTDQARQVYEVRSAIEGLAGRLFACNASPDHRERLHALLAELQSAAKAGEAILQLKDTFYDVLFEGGGNEFLKTTSRSINARVSVLRFLSLTLPGRAEQSVSELRDIVEAIDANDPDAAAAACSRHVEQAGKAGLAALEAQNIA